MLRSVLTSASIALMAVCLYVPVKAQQNQQDMKQLQSGADKWVEAYEKKNAKAVADRYTDDAIIIPAYTSMVQGGKSNIEKFWEGDFKAGATNIRLVVTDGQISGDRAWATGTWKALLPSAQDKPSQQREAHGDWVNLLQKVGNDWKIKVDSWNMLPYPGMEQP
jgi:uncharacterized protein (TIGR02246 family)